MKILQLDRLIHLTFLDSKRIFHQHVSIRELFDYREMNVDMMWLDHTFHFDRNIEFLDTIHEVHRYILIRIYLLELWEFFHQDPKVRLRGFFETMGSNLLLRYH